MLTLESGVGPRSFPGTISGQTTVQTTVIHPITQHPVGAVNPPQLDAPPFTVTAAAGVPLIDLLGDIPDIAPTAPAAPTIADRTSACSSWYLPA